MPGRSLVRYVSFQTYISSKQKGFAMDQAKIKQLVAAAITFGTLSIPGFSDWLHAVGGTAEVMTLTGSLFVVIHGIYSKIHDKVVQNGGKAAAIVLTLLIPAVASAQAAEHDRGGVLVSYNLSDLQPGALVAVPLAPNPPSRADGWTVEADVRLPGAPAVSLVGHVSAMDPRKFMGGGPRVSHNVGPFHIFGHYLFGNLESGGMATDGIDVKKGGGVMIPFAERWEIRIGADHDGEVLYSIVGLGLRF